jgi:carbonic anhydrase
MTDHTSGADCRVQDGSGAIVAMVILFEVTPDGSTTDLLKGVIANLAQAIEPGSVASTGPLDFGEVIAHFKASEKYQYVGSGTTPPCVQGVNFFVSKKPMRLDVPTYRSLKNVLKFNSRYTQNTPGKPNLLQVASKQALAAGCGTFRQPRIAKPCDR